MLPSIKLPAVVHPSLNVKLTQPGVVGPVSKATNVKVTGTPPWVPVPVMVAVRARVFNETDDVEVDMKLLPPPTSVEDTATPQSSSLRLKFSMCPFGPLKSPCP